jgi:hypothetical protein
MTALLAQFQAAAQVTGRSLPAIVMEALLLRLGGARLGLTEYIDYQLYQDDLSWEQKRRFGGRRQQSVMEEILVDDYSRFISLDKVTMYALLDGYGLAIPRLRATYGTLRPTGVRQLHSVAELSDFLHAPANRPLYFKRAFGSYGRGNVVVTACEDGQVVTGGGKRIALGTFAAQLGDAGPLGWLLQEPLRSHSAIVEWTGSDKVSGVRLHTFLTRHGVVATHAVFKINAGKLDSDNFAHGASGNMLASDDIASGSICRTAAGVGPDQRTNAPHPVSGRNLVGLTLPYWEQTVALATEAQKAFPGFLCPGWDIAICDDGPRILEVNAFGDIDLPQHASRTPFANDALLALMRERKLDGLLTASPRHSKRSPANHRLGVRRHHWPW